MTEENQGDKENEKDNEKLKNIAKRIGISPNNSLSKEVEENLKKELNIVKRDYKSFRQEFSDLINGVNNGNNETRTLVIKPNETK